MVQSHFGAFSIGENQSGRIVLRSEQWGMGAGGDFLSFLPPFVLQQVLSLSVVCGPVASKPWSPQWRWAQVPALLCTGRLKRKGVHLIWPQGEAATR